MPAKLLPAAVYLHECFTYDPAFSPLWWRVRPLHHFVSLRAQKIWNTKFPGKEAGCILKGRNGLDRRYVYLNGGQFYAHRIIYKMMTGEEPDETVDHRFGNALDNRWDVLRPATPGQQVWNRGLKSNNTTGYRYVFKTGERFFSTIFFKGQHYYLGTFDTAEAAHVAAEAKAQKLHGEFYRAVFPISISQ